MGWKESNSKSQSNSHSKKSAKPHLRQILLYKILLLGLIALSKVLISPGLLQCPSNTNFNRPRMSTAQLMTHGQASGISGMASVGPSRTGAPAPKSSADNNRMGTSHVSGAVPVSVSPKSSSAALNQLSNLAANIQPPITMPPSGSTIRTSPPSLLLSSRQVTALPAELPYAVAQASRRSLPENSPRLVPRPLTAVSAAFHPASPGSSSSETETEVDSDSTFVPGRIRSKKSLSQPDLTALRTRLEGWAGGVAKGQAAERMEKKARGQKESYRDYKKRNTPPTRTTGLPLSPEFRATHLNGWNAAGAPTHISNLRRSSPRNSLTPLALTPTSPSTPSSSDGLSPKSTRMRALSDPYVSEQERGRVTLLHRELGLDGWTQSDDADDDYDGTTDSPSSGSLTFSPKRKGSGLRNRRYTPDRAPRGSLGLTFSPEVAATKREDMIPDLIERRLQESSLLPLRLLAIVPSAWGILLLLNAVVTGVLWVDLWPWGVDLRKSSIERMIAGETNFQGVQKAVDRGDMLLAMAWVSWEPS